MKKINVIYGCLVFVLLVSMCSCGARKVSKKHSKEETKSEVTDNSVINKQTDTNIKTTTTVKVDDKNETVTEETTISPEDNTKEAFIIEKDGTKVLLKNTKKVYKKTTQKNNTSVNANIAHTENVKESVKEEKAVKQVNTSKKENSSKEVDKKAFNPFNLLWFIVQLLIIYVFYRIYKKLPLVPKI